MGSKYVSLALLLLALAVIAVVIKSIPVPNAPVYSDGVVCTMEAKLCPDGSYVGRTGPNCEFAACPQDNATPQQSARVETKLDQGSSALDVKVVPLSLVEDSRCAVDVQCVWAGTVRVRALIESGLGQSVMVMELGKPITTEAETVTLVAVSPEPRAGRQITAGDYRFTFEITKRVPMR